MEINIYLDSIQKWKIERHCSYWCYTPVNKYSKGTWTKFHDEFPIERRCIFVAILVCQKGSLVRHVLIVFAELTGSLRTSRHGAEQMLLFFLVHWNQWHWTGFFAPIPAQKGWTYRSKIENFQTIPPEPPWFLKNSPCVFCISPEPGLLVINCTCSRIVDGEICPVSLVLFGDLQVASSCVVFCNFKTCHFC